MSDQPQGRPGEGPPDDETRAVPPPVSWEKPGEAPRQDAPPPVPPSPSGPGPDPYGAPPPAPGFGQQQYSQQQYGQQQYGQPGSGGQQPGYAGQPDYGYGAPVRSPESAQVRSRGILWLVLNLVSLFFCANLGGIVGAVLAGVALSRADTDPRSAQGLVRWSWIAFAVGLALGVLAIVGLLFFGFLAAATDPSSGFGTDY